MPKLIKNGAISPIDDLQFVPLAEWQAESGQPLLLAVDDEPQPEFAQAAAIAIDFGAFNDGRGLSLAVLLRTRVGFTGELRAVGDVHHDLTHYLVRCGFTSLVLADDRDADVALRGVSVHSRYYQASVSEPSPLVERLKEVA